MNKIEENNRMIAEFMGFSFEPWKGEERLGDDLTDTEYCYDEEGNPVDELLYHSSWDWLIPIIKKCRENQRFGSQHLISNISNRLMTLDKLSVYANISDFIEWYNQQNK